MNLGWEFIPTPINLTNLVKEIKMFNEVFEINAIARLNTIAPVALGVEMKNLFDKVVRTGYFDQHDCQTKQSGLYGVLTISGKKNLVAITPASKYGFSRIEEVEGRPEQIRGSIGGKFDTTNGFQGMNPEDTLEVIMQSESFVF